MKIKAALMALMVIVIIISIGVFTGSNAESPKKITIRKLKVKLMKKPKFYGKSVQTLVRGQFVSLIDKKGKWLNVKSSSGKEGWIYSTATVQKKTKLSSMRVENKKYVSADEAELASRGFTPEIESKYKKKNPKLNYSHLTTIEKFVVNPSKLKKFIVNGKLKK